VPLSTVLTCCCQSLPDATADRQYATSLLQVIVSVCSHVAVGYVTCSDVTARVEHSVPEHGAVPDGDSARCLYHVFWHVDCTRDIHKVRVLSPWASNRTAVDFCGSGGLQFLQKLIVWAVRRTEKETERPADRADQDTNPDSKTKQLWWLYTHWDHRRWLSELVNVKRIWLLVSETELPEDERVKLVETWSNSNNKNNKWLLINNKCSEGTVWTSSNKQLRLSFNKFYNFKQTTCFQPVTHCKHYKYFKYTKRQP
jgi:hypothetical protein